MSITYLLKKYCKIMYQLKLLFVILISIVSANSFSQTSLEVVPVYKKNNLDNSTTLYNPKAKLYGIEKSLSGQNKGICSLFGHDSFVSGSAFDFGYTISEMSASLDDDGEFKGFAENKSPYFRVTCRNNTFLWW